MSSDEERTRDEIDKHVNDEPVESVQEAVTEDEVESAVKPNAKAKSKAKPKIKITKEPVEPIKEEVRGAEGTPTEGGKAPFEPIKEEEPEVVVEPIAEEKP